MFADPVDDPQFAMRSRLASVVLATLSLLVASGTLLALDAPVAAAVSAGLCIFVAVALMIGPRTVWVRDDAVVMKGWFKTRSIPIQQLAFLEITTVSVSPPVLTIAASKGLGIGPIQLREEAKPFLMSLVDAIESIGLENSPKYVTDLRYIRQFCRE